MSRSNGFYIEHVPTRTHTPRSNDHRSTIDDKKQALPNPSSIPGSNLLNRNRNMSDFLAGLPKPPTWHEGAICAQTDPEAFYPEAGGVNHEAKRICATCPVLNDCREWAIESCEPWGVWGGLSERERREERARRRKAQEESAA